MFEKLVFTPAENRQCWSSEPACRDGDGTRISARRRMATDRFIAYLEERNRAGWGLIITEDLRGQRARHGLSDIGGLWKDEHIACHRALTDRVQQYEKQFFCQIYSPAGADAFRGQRRGVGAAGRGVPIACPGDAICPGS
jgi:2,4-dienoyl-CoA reductase-like NADH-dependent reductase (Old Yellow Enzyme family)